MAGHFEVFVDAESMFRFRLLAPDGTVMAVSERFVDKPAVAAGIAAIRECAGTGLVTDLSSDTAAPAAPSAATPPRRTANPRAAVVPLGREVACADVPATRHGHVFTVALVNRSQLRRPRWMTAAAAATAR
ncbi:hypothetical protein PSET11_00482 [Arthrobacter ulcerisalmonis]|uniref:DUF1508 domain-containing protein n=1 Tax=Arthrobacter ulcerisalmonis TaxID=2483813 RepID=A0A3P5WFS9_9MICC|nr:DUF1508 domain-containing protein [Arthrobacter ulcerisalmonis]VDC18718.1 hypothetical protein PSET11_00482 [Arthrobacter ulcerisalmonis]